LRFCNGQVFPNVIPKKDGSMQFRVLVVSQDHSLSLASGDKVTVCTFAFA
jgi:hypothetical protein